MDMATTNEDLPAPIGPAAQAIATRIVALRDQLAAEEKAELALIARRKELLAGDDDAAIDKVENGIAARIFSTRRQVAPQDRAGWEEGGLTPLSLVGSKLEWRKEER